MGRGGHGKKKKKFVPLDLNFVVPPSVDEHLPDRADVLDHLLCGLCVCVIDSADRRERLCTNQVEQGTWRGAHYQLCAECAETRFYHVSNTWIAQVVDSFKLGFCVRPGCTHQQQPKQSGYCQRHQPKY
jgi:hypothetical protein